MDDETPVLRSVPPNQHSRYRQETILPDVIHPPTYRPYLILNTTQRCNYRCRMCYWGKPEVARSLRQSDQVMPMDLYRRALEESVPYGRALCLAGGGEFLMDPQHEERLQILGKTLCDHPEIMLYQTTNGSLLTAENLKFLSGVKKVGLTLSIDSVDPLIYASIRRPGDLSKVKSTIRSLREQLHGLGLEEIHLRLNMVLMKRNIFSLPELLHFAKEVQAVVFVDHPQGFGPDDLHQESLFRYPAFANAFLKKCQSLAGILNVEFQRPPAFAIEPAEIDAYHDSLKERKLSCYQLDTDGPVQVSPNGDVSICCQNLVFGNLGQQPFQEIFFSPRYNEYRQAIAEGKPLPPCDRCRHLYRNAPYLYDSSVYNMDIPPAARNLDPEPDFEREGFFDWLDELSDKQLRHHLRLDYRTNASWLTDHGISAEIADFERLQKMNDTFLSLIQARTKVLVCPAGKQSAWLMKHSILPHADIVGFADRNPDLHGKSFHGHTVVAPRDIPSLKPGVVLVASDIHKIRICTELERLGKEGIKLMPI